MDKISRRTFFKFTGAAVAAGTVLHPRNSQAFTGKCATIIDVSRCDGCAGESTPRCVRACREHNRSKFPEPVSDIKPYWPHKHYEDWSKKRDVTDTLQPYNWIFVQRIELPNRISYVPRRCMHCDNPPCVSLCPFGALSKEKAGNTVISDKLCFGGAKCRDVCPWHIPQRQAGVGLYLKMMPEYAGGGVMYKCDMCNDRVSQGKTPACVEACTNRLKDRTAMLFGEREAVVAMARERAEKEGLYLYGLKQNGGTSTIYLSQVPFETIDNYLKAKQDKFQMPTDVPNPLEGPHKLARYFVGGVTASIVAAVAGVFVGKAKASKEPIEPPTSTDHPAITTDQLKTNGDEQPISTNEPGDEQA